MAFNRSKRPRLALGLGLPIAPFGAFGTLRLHLYMLPHEVVTSPHQRVFRHISMLRGVLREKDRLAYLLSSPVVTSGASKELKDTCIRIPLLHGVHGAYLPTSQINFP